jgi:antitoxin CptB
MKPKKNIQIHEIAKLQWACRRGMLELDVLLRHFLEEIYPSLSDEDKKLFILLLDESDPHLFAWIMGHEEPEDPAYARMTKAIQHHARSRIQH